MSLSLKDGPRRAVLHPDMAMPVAILIVRDCFQEMGMDCQITSGVDFHTTGLHPKGKAVDFRTRDIPYSNGGLKKQLTEKIRARVGPDFDVILEDPQGPNEHIHLEHDPQHDGSGVPAK